MRQPIISTIVIAAATTTAAAAIFHLILFSLPTKRRPHSDAASLGAPYTQHCLGR